MADTAAALVIQLAADTKAFQKEMRAATGVFDAEGRKIERRQAQLKKQLETGWGKVGSVISAAAFIGFGRSILNTADALSDAAQQLGVTTQQLQGLDYAARVSGASSDKLATALGFLADGLGEAQRGEGAMAAAMRASGIQMGTTIQVLFDVADRVKAARTETEKMNIATTYLGAKAGKTMVSFLNQGADGLRRLQEEASKKGQIWDSATLAKLDGAKDSFETLQKALVNIAALPASVFINDLSGLLDAIAAGDWQAGIDKLARLMPALAGAAVGGRVAGLPGALVGGTAGIFAGALLPQDAAPAAPSAPKNTGLRRTAVPKSAAQGAADAAAAARALADARDISEMLAAANEDAKRSADDVNESLRDVVRTQDSALLARAQGWSDFADIQKEVIDEQAKLEIQSIEAARDADLRALEVRKQADMNRLTELNGTLAQIAELEASYRDQRINAEAEAANEITAVRARQAGDVATIETNQIRVNDQIRSGLIDIGLAGRQGFDSLKSAAAGALEQLAQMILQMYVLKPLVEGLMGPAGGGTGGLIGSVLKSLPGFASGGYTGGERGNIQGVVHGQEFVVNAPATAKNRALLESINAGRQMPSLPSPAGRVSTTPMSITIRQEPGVFVEQVGTSPAEVEFIARRVLHREGAAVAALSQMNPNGELAKATSKTIRASRRRT